MREKYAALDALRGVAALAVAYSHARVVLAKTGGVENAALAVDFFFMLSAFVLTHAYGQKLADGKVSEFLRARVIRLYPLIILGTLIGAARYAIGQFGLVYVTRLAVQGAMLIPEPFASPLALSIFPLDPPAWSLFYEMVASVLFGFGLWRFRLKTAVVLGAAALLWVIYRQQTLNIGFTFSQLIFGFIRVFFSFGVGVALYRLRDHLRVPALPLPILVVILLVALIWPSTSRMQLVVATCIIFPLLILSGSNLRVRGGGISHLSGEISYPLYILHWPFYVWIGVTLSHLGISLQPVVLIVGAMIFASVASLVALRFYDLPIRQWLGRPRSRKGSLVLAPTPARD